MEGVGIIVCLLSLLVATKADYSCVCNNNVELTVFSAMSEQASQLGSMYEFDCKATMPGGDSNQTWSAVAFEHKLGYVKVNDNATIQMCQGDPAASDTVTTPSVPRAAGSSAATGSSVSLDAQTTFTTMPASSAIPVTSLSASSFTTPPPTTTETPTYPTTAGLASTTEHDITTTSGITMTFVESSTTSSAVSCPTGSSRGLTTTFQQSCYEFVLHHSTWNSAEADCRHNGGHLMHITSAVEQDFITKYLLAHFNHEVWIGLNDHNHEENFEWSSGAPLTYTHWDPSRKNFLIHGLEDCVALQPSHQGLWDDRQCSGFLAATHSYVCQYSGQKPGSVIIG